MSSSLIDREARPLGNAVATAATAILPWSGSPWAVPSACTACGHHVAVHADGGDARAAPGRAASGVTAFATSERTLPGVSAPSRVVRSMSPMMRSSAQAFEVVLIERVPSAGRPLLEPDGVDAGDAVQVATQVGVVRLAAQERDGALPGDDLGACHA